MKVKILFIKFTVFFFIISVSLAEEIKFKADSMNLKNEGNLVIAYNSETILPKKKLTITSNKVEYDKKKDEVVFTGNVFFQDKNKNFIIQGNKIKYIGALSWDSIETTTLLEPASHINGGFSLRNKKFMIGCTERYHTASSFDGPLPLDGSEPPLQIWQWGPGGQQHKFEKDKIILNY